MVGFSGVDDAAIYRIAEDRALVVTTDFFPPMVDDPYTFGQVAAANALSDVWAMGGKPLVALNIVGFPINCLAPDVLADILNGGASKVVEAGCTLGGGHTVEDAEVKYGLAVTGEVHPDRIWQNGTLQAGHVLLLTKPIGTGLINSSVKVDHAETEAVREAVRWMTMLNGKGFTHLEQARLSGVTDITGFGLLGHAREMAAGSSCHVRIDQEEIPLITGLETCFKKKYRTKGATDTQKACGDDVLLPDGCDPWVVETLFDPQTSGGLLIAVDPDDADKLTRGLVESGLTETAIVGEVIPKDDGPTVRVR